MGARRCDAASDDDRRELLLQSVSSVVGNGRYKGAMIANHLTEAPFTPEQVLALSRRQSDNNRHPYTCGNRTDHPFLNGDKGVLIPTVRGWICQFCDYTQDYAHASDIE